MAEQEGPKATEAPVGNAPSQPSPLEAVLEATWAKPEFGSPPKDEGKQEQVEPKEESAEAETTVEETAVEQPVEPAEGAETQEADADGEKPEQAVHALTPEEENLLRRQKATAEEIAQWAKIPVAERNKLLRPAREAQRKLDELFGMSRDKREAAIKRELGVGEQTEDQQSQIVARVRDRLKPDPNVIKEVAKDNGLDEKSVAKLVDSMLDKQAAMFADQEGYRHRREIQDRAAELDASLTATRAELTQKFPALKNDAEWETLQNDPMGVAMFQVLIAQGRSVGDAAKLVLNQQAAIKYLPNAMSKAKADLVSADKKVREGSPTRSAPNARAKPADGKPGKGASINDYMDYVWKSQSAA